MAFIFCIIFCFPAEPALKRIAFRSRAPLLSRRPNNADAWPRESGAPWDLAFHDASGPGGSRALRLLAGETVDAITPADHTRRQSRRDAL
jgi:hypothetical protein